MSGTDKIKAKLIKCNNSLRQQNLYVASADGPISWRSRSSADVGYCVKVRARRPTARRRTLKADGRQIAENTSSHFLLVA